ncbi:Non-intrinsic ABC protein 8 isoform 1 [Dorcoceras hygrometricum]|uniref:Non-intrinsic ABC protein 8 isoform 1 n=1 Tax=Dorcoceras hygrometricum TaxID=472368 RepID=A0A2Z7C560_9LAMI|nr:Non-intrinsic ABC protein 8 isoform 1 [Dorcoceras hygrometricum]
MAAARVPPLFTCNLSNPERYHIHRTQKIKLNLTNNLNSRKISHLPSLFYLRNDEAKSRKSSILFNYAYVSGPAPVVSENEPKIDDSGGDEIPKLQHVDLISWGVLWNLVSRHKWRVLVSILTLLGCTTSTLAMPIYSGRFFEVLIGARPEPIGQVLSKVGILYLVEPIFTIIFVINMNAMWEKVMSSLRAQIFQSVLIQKVEFFDRYKIFWQVIGTLCLLFALSVQLAPILGLLMFTVSVLVAVYKRTTVNVFKAHGSAQASMADCVTETFAAIRTVRSFGGEKRQMSIFGQQILEYEDSGMKLGKFKSINESLTRIAVYVSLMALYSLGGGKVKAVQGVVNTFGDLRGVFAAVERINTVLSGAEIDEPLAYALEKDLKRTRISDKNLESLFVNGSNAKMLTRGERYMSSLKSTGNMRALAESGDIYLEDVYFSYPLRPDVQILQGLDLSLKCGTVTALVGPSGAGKSTVVQLLARFYEPTKGRITVGGEDLRSFDKSEWARVVSIVNQVSLYICSDYILFKFLLGTTLRNALVNKLAQEPVLFSVSVGENIAYGLPDDYVSKDDIIKAAKAANAHEFIISLPQGYDTLVGERGGLLSGGQRQRVAIARALLKNAPILILDEATSALDTVSERLVQNALNRLMKGRTTLVIAHRLSTVQNADQIALFSDGKISELGTHIELLEKKGGYASLVCTQRLAFE